MNVQFKGITTLCMVLCLSSAAYSSAHINISNPLNTLRLPVKVDSTADQAFLKTASAIMMKQLLAANLAADKGNKTKALGKMMIGRLNTANEQIRILAKSRNIALTTAVPDGGMRPDGRIDSAPENMKDTIRVKTGGGEAGNNGSTNNANANMVRVNDSVDELRNLTGDSFDQAYLNMIHADRQILLPMLETAAKSSHSATRKFARAYLTTVKKSPALLMR